MATRSALTVTTGTTITSAWGNGVRDGALTTETATPSGVSHGAHWVRTDEKRIMMRDSGGNDVRIGWYESGGRTWFSTDSAAAMRSSTFFAFGDYSVPDSTSTSVIWGGGTQSDNFIVDAWPSQGGTQNESIAIPVSGLYMGWAKVGFTATWTPTGDNIRVTVGGVSFEALISARSGFGVCQWGPLDLTAGAVLTCAVQQYSGSTKTANSFGMRIVRLGA